MQALLQILKFAIPAGPVRMSPDIEKPRFGVLGAVSSVAGMAG